jgi:hypothetical protein
MKAIIMMSRRSIKYFLLVGFFVIIVAFLLPGPAYADNCTDDPLNAADCMRTPGFREAITLILISLGIAPVVIADVLQSLSGGSTLNDALNKSGVKITNRVRNALQSSKVKQVMGQTAPTTSTAPGTPAPRWSGPIKDRIFDRDKAVKILKQFKMPDGSTVWEAVKNLDPNSDDYWQKVDDLLKHAKDNNRRVKAITIKHKEDKNKNRLKGVENDKEVVIVIEQPEYGPYTPPATTAPPPPTQAPPTQAPPTQAPPTQAPPTQAPPTQPPPTQAPPTPPPKKKEPEPDDWKTRKRKFQKKLEEAQRELEKRRKWVRRLVKERAKLKARHEICYKTGAAEAIIEGADLFLSLLGVSPPKTWTDALKKAFMKTLVKKTHEQYYRSTTPHRPPPDTWKLVKDLIRGPTGKEEKLKDQGVPGGVSKYFIMKFLEKIPRVGPGYSKVYDVIEGFSSLWNVKKVRGRECENLRNQLKQNLIQQNALRREIRDWDMKLGEAQAALGLKKYKPVV